MAKSVKDIMQMIKENDIKMVDFKMVDINGQFRHVTIPAQQFSEETMKEGIGFDASNYGYAVVELDGKFGFINESGDEVCEIKYEYMSCFNNQGLAQITIPYTEFDRTYWIDTQGKEYYIYLDSDEIHPLI